MREPVPGSRLGHAVADFLADLAHANRSAATIRAYRTDLASFTAYHRGPPESITPDVLRGYFATLAHLAPATRARHEATLAPGRSPAARTSALGGRSRGQVPRVQYTPARSSPTCSATRRRPATCYAALVPSVE